MEETGLNIPKLLEVTKMENRWALVSEHIEGKSLEELIKENPERKAEYMDMFIDIQLNILSKTAPMLNKLKDKMKTQDAIETEFIPTKIIAKNDKAKDAIEALQVLGYARKDIDMAISNIDASNMSVEDIIKQGLKYLGM